MTKYYSANLEARGGIEPPIKVLQTFALPLGDRASEAMQFYQKIPRPAFPRRESIKNKSREAMFRPPRSCRTEFPGWMSDPVRTGASSQSELRVRLRNQRLGFRLRRQEFRLRRRRHRAPKDRCFRRWSHSMLRTGFQEWGD
jgi:hypothetical protein